MKIIYECNAEGEGNALKDIIGITRKCHTSPIYAALGMKIPNEISKESTR